MEFVKFFGKNYSPEGLAEAVIEEFRQWKGGAFALPEYQRQLLSVGGLDEAAEEEVSKPIEAAIHAAAEGKRLLEEAAKEVANDVDDKVMGR